MARTPASIEQHLMCWADAYGADLAVPTGKATKRPTAETQQLAPKLPEPASGLDQTTPIPETVPQETVPQIEPASPDRRHPRPTVSSHIEEAGTGDSVERITDSAKAATPIRVMFVGEMSGADSGESWQVFESPAGQLLKRIITQAMGLRRKDICVTNLGEGPSPDQSTDGTATHHQHVARQVEATNPEVIVCLGKSAAQSLLGTKEPMSRLRSNQHEFANRPLIVTWHPAQLLREPAKKVEAWDDIKKVNQLLGLPEVPKTSG